MKTKKEKLRLISLILCAAILSGSFVSCSEGTEEDTTEDTASVANSDASEETAEAAAETESETESETEENNPDLPEVNYDGYTFRMLSKGKLSAHWSSKDLTAEEMTGEAINDAVYERNSYVGEKYGVEFVEYSVADYYNQQNEFSQSVQAGSDDYDMAALKPEAVVSSFIEKGYLIDLKTVPYMDLSRSWYDQNSIEQMSLGGKVFSVMGDMLTMDDDATAAIFFNKTLASSNGLPDLYEMVNEGTWTIDKLTEYAAIAAKDANGNGTMDAEDDVWGALSEYATTFALISGSGYTMITKDENDVPTDTSMDEHYVAMYEKVLKLQNNWDITLYAEGVSGIADIWKCMDITFQSDRALFNVCWLNRASVFREMETDFGIIPMPKYDEAQENYHSFVHMYCANCIIVPITNPNLEKTGVIIEALSAASVNTLKPAYYEKTLKGKGARDEESSNMLDIIFATRIFDLGYMFNWGQIYSSVGSLAGKDGGDISGYSSKMQKTAKLVSKTINKTMEQINKTE